MLISESAKIKWNSKTQKHYIEKGYIFTKMGDEFEVKVEDLTHSSITHITIQCDMCKEVKDIQWNSYFQSVKEDGTYYCKKCGVRHFYENNTEKIVHHRKFKSFKQWCVENNKQYYIDLWDSELNNCDIEKLDYLSREYYYFKTECGKHPSELKQISYLRKCKPNKLECKACNSIAQYLIDMYGENALTLYWDYELNNNNPWKINKLSNDIKVWIKCQDVDYHGSYLSRCSDFSYNNSRCPYCSHAKTHYNDSFGSKHQQNLHLWSEKNKNSPYEYSPKSHSKIWWKCECGKHEDYLRSVKESNRCDFRCPECVRERDESFLQEKVRLYINELGYTVAHEYNCSIKARNPKTNGYMPYDNEVKELKLIIEVHGEQHYDLMDKNCKFLENNETPKDFLYKRKLYDRYKRFYAVSKGYYYLELPYWAFDNKNTYRDTINNKILEIKNNLKQVI